MATRAIEDPEVTGILDRARQDLAYFCKVFLPERFSKPFSPKHKEIFDAFEGDNQRVVVAANRGMGKTSSLMAYLLQKIVFREVKFIVYVSASADQAKMQTENLKAELVGNPMIRKLFGPMETKDSFASDKWVTRTGVMVMPRGRGQQVRGLLHGDDRPDLLAVDDVEDAEMVRSEDRRFLCSQWFHADLLNSVELGSDNWRVLFIGTPLHEDGLIVKLMEDGGWHSVRIELCNEDYESNWPQVVSNKEVRAMADEYKRQGLLHVFHMEHRCVLVPPDETRSFRQSYFQYYSPEDYRRRRSQFETVLLVDPAKTTKKTSCDTAIIGVSLDYNAGSIYVVDIDHGHYAPDEVSGHTCEMASRLDASVVSVEVTGLNDFITFPMKQEIVKRGLPLRLHEQHSRVDKLERIAALIPFYRGGMVYHNAATCAPLEAQLLSFPRSRRQDVMDALANLVPLLEDHDRYFNFFPKSYRITPDPLDVTRSKGDVFDEDRFYEEAEELPDIWRAV